MIFLWAFSEGRSDSAPGNTLLSFFVVVVPSQSVLYIKNHYPSPSPSPDFPTPPAQQRETHISPPPLFFHPNPPSVPHQLDTFGREKGKKKEKKKNPRQKKHLQVLHPREGVFFFKSLDFPFFPSPPPNPIQIKTKQEQEQLKNRRLYRHPFVVVNAPKKVPAKPPTFLREEEKKRKEKPPNIPCPCLHLGSWRVRRGGKVGVDM